jgi:hypothetical protein
MRGLYLSFTSLKEESPMTSNGISRQILVFSVTTLFAGGPAFACGGSNCSCDTLAQAITQISAAEAQEDGASALSTQLRMIGDQDFMRVAMEDSAAKILLAQLALRKSQRDDLK